MAESSPQTDGVVIKCSYDKCISQRILPELGTAGIQYSELVLKKNSEEQSLHILSKVKHTCFILVFCCFHVKSYKKLDTDLRTYSDKVTVIVDSSKQRPFTSQFTQFQAQESTLIIQHLQQILLKSDSDTNEYYPPLPSRRPRLSESEQTIPKKTDDFASNEKPGTVSSKVDRGFINVETFDSDDVCNRGTHVLQSSCKPKVLVVSSVNEIKRRFNGANQDERENLSKQILSETIKGLVKDCNFLELLYLLDIDDSRIQRSVFNAIDTLQLQTNISSRCIMGSDNLKGAKHLLKLCGKWFSNQVLMLRLLPTTMDTIAILFLSSVSSTHQSSLVPETQTFVESLLPDVNKLVVGSKLACDTHLQNMLISVQKLLENLGSVGRKNDTLHMANFRDILVDDESRVRFKQKFEKSMTYLEQYSFLIAVMNQMLQKSEILIVNYVFELTGILVERISKKAKLMQTTFSLLTLVTKGVVNRLFRGPITQRTTSEYQLTLCKVLNLYLASSKVNQLARYFLLDSAAPLLFHENKDVVKNMVYLFNINNYCSKDIREQVSKHIVQQLAIVNFKIDGVLNSTTKVGLEPTWVTFAGTVSGERGVVLHVLVPTLHCIAAGSMTDYKQKANQKETRKHLNSLDVLKHLQDEKSHMNLIELLAFQCRPLPIFYVTDHSIGYDLNSYLLDARRCCRWLSQRELITIVADAIDGISFLHRRKVIHRNMTTFAFCMRKQNTIALHDFSLAKVLENNTGFLSELENTDVPVLWSAPESILEDHYDVKTDTWMIGQFMYEVFTHGCHPYTEVYGTTTEQLLEYIVFQDLKPHKWPCVPKEIHDIICQCVAYSPENRIDINEIGAALNNVLVSLHGGRKPRLSQVHEEDKKYPELDATQSEPERGLPHLFKQLKQNNTQERTVIRKSYFNTRLSQRRNKNVLQITENDVRVADKPIWQSKFNHVSVFEPVTIDFVHSLPHLDKQTCIDVFHMTDSPSREERRHCQGAACPFLLKYRLKKCERLLNIASARIYNDPEQNVNKYLSIVVKVLQFVSEMHKRNWILRDLCAENLCVLEQKNEVTMARLGRMLWLDTDNVLDDCIIDKIKSDRQRWLPIEILQNGQYSKEGDIYMVAMVIYEFFTALGIHEDNPMAGHLDCAPFAKLEKTELLKTLYSGEVPLQPDYCPDWLYEIMKQCWDRDRTKRPTAENMINQINEMIERSRNLSVSTDQDHYSDVDENYEPLTNKPTSDYDDLCDENLKDSTPTVGSETNKQFQFTETNNKIPQYDNNHENITSSLDVQFSCVNSDSFSESNLSAAKSRSEYYNVSFSTGCINTDFNCVNSVSSESENEYVNDGLYMDGRTVGPIYHNYLRQGNVGLKHPNDEKEKLNSEDLCSNGSTSTVSSTYFCVNNLTVFNSSSDHIEGQIKSQVDIEQSTSEKMKLSEKTDRIKDKQRGNKNDNNRKRSRFRSREKLKFSICNNEEGNSLIESLPSPCNISTSLTSKDTEELRNTSDQILGATNFDNESQHSSNSGSSSYYSCDEHIRQTKSSSSLEDNPNDQKMQQGTSNKHTVDYEVTDSSPRRGKYYQDFDEIQRKVDKLEPKQSVLEKNDDLQYTDFDQSTDENLFKPPSNDPDDYLTPVYYV